MFERVEGMAVEGMAVEGMASEGMASEGMASEGMALAEDRAAAVPRPALPPSRDRRWGLGLTASPRGRLTFGVALVVVLATAWVFVGRGAADPVALGSSPTTRSTTRSTTTPSRARAATAPDIDAVVAVPRWVPAGVAATCRAHGASPSRVVVDCTPGRGVARLRYRAFASVADLRHAYAVESARSGGAGPSACAAGLPEERSWSSAASPARPAGRYRCAVAAGNARLVWTSEATKVLGLATRTDRDLRTLYQWWTTVPGPNVPG